MVYVFLADGFEEMEAVAPIDILRRLGISVTTVGVTGERVTGSHGIEVTADTIIDKCDFSDASALILPGGMPGTLNLSNSQKLCSFIKEADTKGILLAALCAAPSVFLKLGILKGRDYTCYPGFEEETEGNYKNVPLVVSEGKSTVITAWGPGAAYRFAFAVGQKLTGKDLTDLKASMMMCGDE